MKKTMGMMLPLLALSGMMPDMKQPGDIRIVNDADYEALINEYKLIQQKKSKLSRRQRDAVEYRIKWLISKGKIDFHPTKEE